MSLSEASTRHRASTLAILDFAWDAGEFRADHAIAASGLTRSTVLTALDSLIDIGLVQELPNTSAEDGTHLGRPARRFELRADAGAVIGLDAGRSHVTAIVADLTGRVLSRHVVAADGVDDAPAARRRIAFDAVDHALAAAGKAPSEVVGIGVGVPAPVNGRGESPTHPEGFWQNMNAGLQDALSRKFPGVRVENDAALAAIAESTGGQGRGYDHFVAILVGRRLGSAVFLEGQIARGAHGGVGELEAFSYIAGVGSAVGLGDRAEQWARTALADGRVPAEHPWARLAPEEVTAANLLAHARLDDPVTRPLLDDLAATLGRVCDVLARFYDPELIVVCGSMAGALGDVLNLARDYVVRDAQMPPPEIVASGFGGDVVALGGVSAAREAAREIVLPLLTERYERRVRTESRATEQPS